MTGETVRNALNAAMKELNPIFEEIKGQSDRAAAIAASAYFEQYLNRAIRSRFVPLSRTTDDEMFTGRGLLSSFRDRCDLGYALGLYGKMTRSDLRKLVSVRNRFAHELHTREFSNPEIAKLCGELTLIKTLSSGDYKYAPGPKDAFIMTIMFIGNMLSQHSGNIRAENLTLP